MDDQEPNAEEQQAAADSTAVMEDEKSPDFPQLQPGGGSNGSPVELSRFGGVQVVLTAELGRAKLSLNELMELSQGAVVELNRPISAPVELVAQGVPLGNGEVVVVDDQFAVRIKEIYQA